MTNITPRSSMDELRTLDPHSPTFDDDRNAFFRDRLRYFKAAAVRTCRHYRLDLSRHLDEVESLVLAAALTLVNDIIDDKGGRRDEIRNFEAYLERYIRAEMKAYAGSTAMMPASNMHGVSRRRIRYEKFRSQLNAELGREPSVREVLDRANADAYTAMKNPRKNGLLLTESDAFSPTTVDLEHIAHVEAATSALLHPTEGKECVSLIVAEAEKRSPQLGDVARAWIGEFYEAGGHHTNDIADVMAATGLTRKQVVDSIARLREIGMEVVDTYMSAADNTPHKKPHTQGTSA